MLRRSYRQLISLGSLATVAASLFAWPSGNALAQAETEPAGPIEEVIVTAEFRESSAQATPISITAINAEMMEARSQTNIYQVASQVPNVTLAPAGSAQGGSAMIAFIRGIGQTDFNYANEPGVGLYVDDVYYPTLTGSLIELLDLDRVEVLRGPQGTLAGRNSIGGAIKLFSRKPMGEDGGSVGITYGDFDRVDVRGTGDLTLIDDKLFARVSGFSRTVDGYVDRLDYACTHPGSGLPTFTTGQGCLLGTEGGQSMTAMRGSLRWVPNDSVEFVFTADATNEDSEARPGVLLNAIGNGQDFGIGAIGLLLGTDFNPADANNGPTPVPIFFDQNDNGIFDAGVDVPLDCRFVTFGLHTCDSNPQGEYVSYATYLDPENPAVLLDSQDPWKPLSVPPITTFNTHGVSLTVDWQIGDNFSLKSITAYRKYDSSFAEDTDSSPLGVQELLQTLNHDQTSQELRLNGTTRSGSIDYTLGLFYFDQDGTLEARVDLPWAALDFTHGPDPTPSTHEAIFGNFRWNITDALGFSAGLRNSDDEKTYTFHRHNPDGTLPAGPCAGPPGLPANPANCAVYGVEGLSSTFKDSRTDYRAVIDYTLRGNIMTYAQYSTGYKGGGVNPRPFVPDQATTFRPEELDSIEIGVKTTLLNRHLQFNAALFSNDFKDIQMTFRTCPASVAPAPCFQPQNAGSADVDGWEFETIWYAGDTGLSIDAAYGSLDFQYTKTDPLTEVTLDMVPPYTPETTWSTGIQYDIELGSGGRITPRIDATYQSELFSEPTNAISNMIEDYTVLNARLTWVSGDESWQAALEVKNLTDEYYYLSLFDLSNFGNAGYTQGQPAWPRTWAVSISRQF